jgi:lysophospholipase L1-like esterase
MFQKDNSNIDTSVYVAVGDSITTGYTNAALYQEGQLNCFANFLSAQFKLIGGGEFKQPLMNENSVGIGFYGNARMVLDQKTKDGHNLQPSYLAPNGDLLAFTENVFEKQGPFNNMSVPSAKLTSLVIPGVGNPHNGFGNFNPFFTRMASNPATASILSDVLALNPTFFTLYIGNNDILTYASMGGTFDKITPLEGGIGEGFISSLKEIVNELTKNGAKGVIANIGDITSIPYFTVIPYNGLILDVNEIDEYNSLYKENGITFNTGENAYIVNDPKTGIRQLEKDELVILEIQLDPEKEKYLTGKTPIPKKYFLNKSEISEIQKAVSSYNDAIQLIAKEKNIGLVDVHAFSKTLKHEINYSHKDMCAIYSSNCVFSLDGLHLNSFGQAILANIFIKTINSFYHTNVELVDAMHYKSELI